MKKKVSIIGFGFVGRGMFNLFDHCKDWEVAAYDIKMPDGWVGDRNRLWPIKTRVQGADLALVCVPTPMGPDGSADISAVEEVCSWVDAPLVCIKSTVPPGTTDALNNKFAGPACRRFHFSPEYMGEPKNFVAPWKYPDPRDARSHDFVMVGGPQASKVLEFFARVMATDATYRPTTARAAELAKYMENAYLAAKVIFCNEFAKIARAFDVDYMELRDLWLNDPRVDPDHTMVFPDAPGFGGKCLPKDVNAIVAAAAAAGYEAELLKAVLRVNDQIRNESLSVPVLARRQLHSGNGSTSPSLVT